MNPIIPGKTLKSTNLIMIVFVLFALLIHFPTNILSQNTDIILTSEESEWIAANTNIKVANELDWPPFDFAVDGEPRGYSIDLIKLIAEKTGLQLEFVNGYSWAELLDLFKEGEIDILPAFYLNDERKEFILYTESYAANPSILVTHVGISEVSKLEDFNGRSVAVISGYATALALEERYPDIKRVYVKDALEGLNSVSLGKTDGFIGSIGTIAFLIEENFIPNIRIIGDVGLKNSEETRLYIGVHKENAILGSILQKGLSNISEEEMKAIRKQWIPIGTEETTNILGFFSSIWQIVIVIIVIFVLLYFILRWIFKKSIKEETALQFGSRKFRIRSITILGILVLIIAAIGWMSVSYIESKFSDNIQLQLDNDLNSAHGRLDFWLNQKKSELKLLGHDQHIIDLVVDLEESFRLTSKPDIHTSRFLRNVIAEHNSNACCVIDRNFINLVSTEEDLLGKQNIIASYKPDIFNEAFNGNVKFIPPILDERVLNEMSPESRRLSSMYFVIPIEDSTGYVHAAMIQQIDPAQGFSEILQLSHVGTSGESYVFDRIGRMLSVSRFEDELKKAGLFQEDQLGELHIEVKDPGGNLMEGYQPNVPRSRQALTLMAMSAVKGHSGSNVDGYHDYRGIPVCGAWMWIDEMELGLATEIDVEEAYRLYHFIRISAFIVLAITIIFLIAAILFTLTLGERANAALIKARDELENRVVERTLELKKSEEKIILQKQLLENTLESLTHPFYVIDAKDYSLLLANSAAKKLGDGEISTCYALTHKRGEPCNSKEDPCPLKIVKETKKPVVLEHTHSDAEGNAKIMEVYGYPIFDEKGEVVQMIEYSMDITERKKVEKRLKSQSTALKSAANGIVITNVEGEIEWVNPAFTELTGYSWKEVIGKNPRVLNSGKHDNAFFKNMWETVLKGDVWHDEIINKKKNGDLYYEEMTITPILNDKQEVIQFVAIKQDITERKRLEEIVIKAKERMEGELNVAKDIQMSMLPLIFPAFPQRGEIDIYAELIPAREVGGDFYDFYFLDENHICFVVGDVSGKGVPAALMMAVTKTLLKSRAGNDKSTASILTHVNNEIAKDNDTYMFITVFMAILNTNTGELVYSNAGHNPSFIIKHDDREVVKLSDLHGPVIGAMEEMTYSETKLFIDKDDIVIAYTDGVTESQNMEEELYSDAKFITFLENWIFSTPKNLIEEIIKSVKEHEGEAEQFDDITALAVQYCSKPNSMVSDEISFTIKNKIDDINTAVEHFESFSEKNEIAMPIVLKFNIAFDELLNNIIMYGYDDDDEHEIEVGVELKGERLVISIADDGIPFNPFKQSPPDTMLTVEERNVGGLGIHIVKNLMDEYTYKRNV
ncbi:MAG: hypothetical protein DRI83_06340, partial [Bacteroidetes bacterium]